MRLSKSRLMAGRQCPKRLWLQVHRPDLAEVSAASEAGFARGHRVGAVAQQLFPSGYVIGHSDNLRLALQETIGATWATMPIPTPEWIW